MARDADFLSKQPGPPQVELRAPWWAIYFNVGIVGLNERLSKADALLARAGASASHEIPRPNP